MRDYVRAHAYVDGFNLLQGVRKNSGPRFVNVRTLATIVSQQAENVKMWLGMRCAVGRVCYYDTEPDAEHAENAETVQYLDALDRLPDCHVRRGFLRHASKSPRRQQKGVDVLLAVDMLEDAHRGLMDVAMLFSGDGDFAPVVEAVGQYGPRVVVIAYSESLANELRLVADVTVELDKLGITVPELKLV